VHIIFDGENKPVRVHCDCFSDVWYLALARDRIMSTKDLYFEDSVFREGYSPERTTALNAAMQSVMLVK